MTAYLLSPRGNFAARENLLAMLEAGELDAYRVRENGTMRLLRLLPVGSTDRANAEWIYDQIEDGRSVQAVAREIHSSTATVRRFLEALEVTEQVEAGEWDGFWAELNGFPQPVDLADEPEGAALETDCAVDAEELVDQLADSLADAAERAASAEAGVVFS